MGDASPRIDHIIITVRDIDTAAREYALMLGFAPSWQGHHPAYGTRNVLFRFENTTLELLAADQPGPGSDMVAASLETDGEGLSGLVFGVDDIDGFAKQLKSKGIAVDAALPGGGTDELSGAQRNWRSLFWPLDAARGVFSFAIQHDSPPESLPMKQTGAAPELCAVDHIVVNTSDGDAAAAFYGDTLGMRLALRQHKPQWGGDMLFFRASQLSVEVVASPKNDPERDRLWGIAFRTRNIDAAHERLAAASVSVSAIRQGRKPGTRVCTVKSHCCSIPTLLIG
jgi:catechol 2,3-dioxygenase-like lactoylglutathione lyase family enzyme